ncbi:MAG: hypothetical protein AAGE52_30010 [Myxococcota bacterium]
MRSVDADPAWSEPRGEVHPLARCVADERLVSLHFDTSTYQVGALRGTRNGLVIDEVLADGTTRRGTPLDRSKLRVVAWGTRYLEAMQMIHADFDESFVASDPVEASRGLALFDLLTSAQRTGTLVEVFLEGDADGWWPGRVVGLSGALVILHLLDDRRLEWNGYVALRLDRAERVALDPISRARLHVLERRGPPSKTFPCTTMESHLASFAGSRTIVGLADADPTASFVGFVEDVDRNTRLQFLTPLGEDDGLYDMPSPSIVACEWNTAYLLSLAQLRTQRFL